MFIYTHNVKGTMAYTAYCDAHYRNASMGLARRTIPIFMKNHTQKSRRVVFLRIFATLFHGADSAAIYKKQI